MRKASAGKPWVASFPLAERLTRHFDVNSQCGPFCAGAFHYGANPNTAVQYITDAYRLLAPTVGSNAAKILFGVALLASGQNSTITGTLAGQVPIRQPFRPWASYLDDVPFCWRMERQTAARTSMRRCPGLRICVVKSAHPHSSEATAHAICHRPLPASVAYRCRSVHKGS
jgi:Natural resistance-associated macrophage protein